MLACMLDFLVFLATMFLTQFMAEHHLDYPLVVHL